MATERVRVEGLKELKRALHELPKATAKNVLRRVGRKRLEPVAEHARSLAPKDEGDLAASIAVSTKLTKRQRSLHRKFAASDVEIFAGAGPHPQASLQEFGTEHHAPQAFMRPAWATERMGVLMGVREDLWTEISKAAQRLARKAARAKK